MYSETLSVKRYSPAVNVLAFGADPTGVADCTPAFNAAIAECLTRDYSTLYVPAGKYKFTSATTSPQPSPTPPVATPDSCWQIDHVSGLCIRGDGALRSPSQEGQFVGTTLVFDFESTGKVGILLSSCTGIRFENLTIQGSTSATNARSTGVYVDTADTAHGTTGIQFHNVVFQWCNAGAVTGYTNNNSELSFYDCAFSTCTTGFKSYSYQAVSQKFIGCLGGGANQANLMNTMFDLSEGGGNITVASFFGANMGTFMKVGPGGKNIGWNTIVNLRLESQGNETTPAQRIRLYEATGSGSTDGAQRTSFDGVVIVGEYEVDDGTSRFLLYDAHEVYAWNITRDAYHQLATPTSKLVEFPAASTGKNAGGTFRCYGSDIPFDSRLNRATVPAVARYSFQDCQSNLVPYPDALHPPLYGPNYLMSVESHCWTLDDGLDGVNQVATGGGALQNVAPTDDFRAGVIACNVSSGGDFAALASAPNAVSFGGGPWRCQIAARLASTSDDYAVRLGFGDDADGIPANGLYFLYSGASNYWQAVTPAGTATTVVVANTSWHTFEIAVDEAGNSAFYIDGGQVHASSSPSAAVGLLPIQVEKTADGPDILGAEIDYYKYEFRPTTRGQFYPE